MPRRLRARRVRPEQTFGDEAPPEPPATDADPEQEVVLADSIGFRVAAGRIVALDVTGDPARISELEIVLLNA